jgi:hypothetical protein
MLCIINRPDIMFILHQRHVTGRCKSENDTTSVELFSWILKTLTGSGYWDEFRIQDVRAF